MTKTTLPVLLLNSIVLFPDSEIRIELDKDSDKEIISLALSYYNNHILIVNDENDLFNTVGVIGYINLKLDLPNNKTRLVIKGMERVIISSSKKFDGILTCEVKEIPDVNLSKEEEIAYVRHLNKKLEDYINSDSSIGNSILSEISSIDDLSKLTDIYALYLPISTARKLEYQQEVDPISRFNMLLVDIGQELKVSEIENDINEKVSRSIETDQRQYILQEKLKVIKEELNDGYDPNLEIEQLKKKINNLSCKNSIKTKLYNEVKRLEMTPLTSPEVVIIRSYIDEMLSLPWGIKTHDNKDLDKAMEVLDKSHYGLSIAKKRIIEYLALLQRTSNYNSPIICLVGPPGVGKTSFAKAISKAMNRKYTKISVGGINDEAEIIGHRRAYMGSSPGRIIKGIKKAGSINPVFVIDEIDKMTKDIKGDPASSLLEVLDKEQNKRFYDNYIEEEFNLSNVMFICTANYKDQIPLELLDRMEVIELSSYSEYEKCEICKEYIIPKLLKSYNLENEKISFSDKAILKIIRDYTKESGVRELERLIGQILRGIIKDMITLGEHITNISEELVVNYLGIEKYLYNKNAYKYLVGVVNGMSYTIYGGDILKIEVCFYRGHGNIITTGMLGDVFKESTSIALSYIKANYKKFNIIYDLLDNSDIHLHVPEGAIRKDGPSAGVAITTALISSFTGKKVPSNISMTGEITLNGEILPVGGLKEKIIGAKRAGVKKIYLPFDNKRDVLELEDYIKEKVTFKFVKNFEEVYEDLLK